MKLERRYEILAILAGLYVQSLSSHVGPGSYRAAFAKDYLMDLHERQVIDVRDDNVYIEVGLIVADKKPESEGP